MKILNNNKQIYTKGMISLGKNDATIMFLFVGGGEG